ncbi:MAG: hypothetical protein COU35_02915 [Candidatus Magasanikbacteria bacterium CG10_big_fil_rev_8_21_14_0_10_47_10]|uniref:Uncharacterized protein n=1 Tax=Candidatus Magasanikbacteria bacterium CG10_big_fil_rev_8_21_14_0_10_47_10 TaxID=1974652 RepID=A0A2H0TQF4_9BACT|nr:MAG: hypothetical protein COU35_02915 [Candidatus Magasanikbacteria bacterium CG10_big_fil_rev_8_21_14_0_10_47_10]
MADQPGAPLVEHSRFIPETPSVEQLPRQESAEVFLEPSRETIPAQAETIDGHIDTLRSRLRKPKNQRPNAIPQVRDELTLRVEQIMEEGLQDAFSELSVVERQEFKLAGERAAMEIRKALRGGHVKIKKIFEIIVGWLKKLPGINRFYLMQEAKIKTDKIVSLGEYEKYTG